MFANHTQLDEDDFGEETDREEWYAYKRGELRRHVVFSDGSKAPARYFVLAYNGSNPETSLEIASYSDAECDMKSYDGGLQMHEVAGAAEFESPSAGAAEFGFYIYAKTEVYEMHCQNAEEQRDWTAAIQRAKMKELARLETLWQCQQKAKEGPMKGGIAGGGAEAEKEVPSAAPVPAAAPGPAPATGPAAANVPDPVPAPTPAHVLSAGVTSNAAPSLAHDIFKPSEPPKVSPADRNALMTFFKETRNFAMLGQTDKLLKETDLGTLSSELKTKYGVAPKVCLPAPSLRLTPSLHHMGC